MRGKGYGKQMIHSALKIGFNEMLLNEISLGVFDFNYPAIKCYQELGFRQYKYLKNVRKFGEEFWNLIMMRLTREYWQREQCGVNDLFEREREK